MKINVIFASREPVRASVLTDALKTGGMSLTIAQRSKETLGFLANGGADLLLVGQKLADEDGIDLIKAIRSRGPCRQIPIVALVEFGAETANGQQARPTAGPNPARLATEALRPPSAWPAGLKTRPAAVFAGSPPPQTPMAPPSSSTVSAQAPDRTSLRLVFFQAGADECLSLNWDVAECLARIKAVLRRTRQAGAEELIKMGAIELNLTSYTLHINGKRVALTSKELDLLYVFLSSPNRVLSRPYLIERVWGYNYFGSPRTVDVHVRRLREKLGPAAKHITTIPCVGYKLIPPPQTRR